MIDQATPLLRKICPSSGERCDCPKGICNVVVRMDSLAIGLTAPLQNAPDNQPAFCEDEGCPQFGTPHICISPEERFRIDKQEAGSLKYALCAQILLLSSGKFALFGSYSMQDGIPLIAIDTWEKLEPHVRTYRKTAEDGYAQEKQAEEKRRSVSERKTSADYDSLFPEES